MRLGVDIGGTKIAIGLFDGEKKLAHGKYAVAEVGDLPSFIKDKAAELAKSTDTALSDISFVGIGVPGTVSSDGSRLLKAPNISIIKEDLSERVSELIGAPVRLVQDSRAAALGEYLFGGARGAGVAVCVTVGTGIGTGIVIDGKIFNGGLGAAGEMGHIPSERSSRPCGCGKCGCLETVAAGKGLDMSAQELLGDGKDARDLFSAARAGHEGAIAILDEARHELGKGLTAIVNLLSPDVLLLSGGISAEAELYLGPIIEYVNSHCYSAGSTVKISVAELGELSPLYGAAFADQ